MEELGISLLAILIATVANFFVGYIWYTPLFGKAWAKELGIEITRKPTSGELGKGMTMNLIGNFFLAYVFAHNIAAWQYVPGMSVEVAGPVASIAQSALFTWLGFFVPIGFSAVAWENKSWKLFFINQGYYLVSLIVAASVLVYMR